MKLTVTTALFHPAPFGGGDGLAAIVGGVESMFTVTVTVALLPATSVAIPVTDWFAPSVVSLTG
jgi:hypothetical protein